MNALFTFLVVRIRLKRDKIGSKLIGISKCMILEQTQVSL